MTGVALHEGRRMLPLTALRFPCAAMIVLTHSRGYFVFADPTAWIQLTQGVSFFFVLSGFILAFHYDRVDRRPWSAFYVARCARIFPAHLAALALYFALVDRPFGAVEDVPLRVATLGANLTLLQSWVPVRAFFWGYNAVAWSLSTELAFYLFFPLLVRRRAGSLPWLGLVATALLALAFVAIGHASRLPLMGDPMAPSLLGVVLVNPFARVFEFVLGIFCCALYRRWDARAPFARWAIVECAAVALALVTMMLCAEPRVANLAPALRYYVVWSGSALSFALLILVFASSDGPLARLLSTRPLVLLGEASFALYLVHVPVLDFIAQRHLLPNDSMAAVVAYWGASLVVAFVLFACIEAPARRWIVGRWARPRGARVAFG